MTEERRAQPFCNLYEIHCKSNFDEMRQDIKDMKKVLMGNGDHSDSLVCQVTLNTEHRKWMETWGRGLVSGLCLLATGSLGTLIYVGFRSLK